MPENNGTDERSLYQKKRVLIPLFLLVAGLLLGGIYWYFNIYGSIATDDAYVDADNVNVSSKILGRVTELAVDEGNKVTQGQVIARLDESDLRAQEKQAQAALEYAQRNVQLAHVNLQKVDDDFRRAQVQFDDKIITQEQFAHAKKALETAAVQDKIALAQVDTSQAQLGVITTQLGNCIITAPMDGVVAKRWVLPGAVVQAAQPIYSLYNLEHIWVIANLEETKFAQVKLGEKAYLTVDAYAGKEFSGQVIQLGSNTASQFALIPPNNAAGNFTKITQRIPVKISIANEGQSRLLPGMSVLVKIRAR
jgi:membrane fusion protein, multidrug efflux system